MVQQQSAAQNVVELPLDQEPPNFTDSGLPREGKLWLLACFLMLITGLLKGINLLILLSYLLIGVWVVNWQVVRLNFQRPRGRRTMLGPIFAGTPGDFEIEITGQEARCTRGLIIENRGTDGRQIWMILRLNQEQLVRIRWQQLFPRRGRFGFEPLRAVCRFPFGLFSRTVELAPASEWIVLPRLGAVNGEQLKQWLLRTTRGDGRQRRRKLRRVMLGAEVHGLRDYRPGDSLRWIHWRSSARRGQLLVCEFEENPSTDLILIVEPWLPPAAKDADRNRLEALISLAGTICREWCRDLSSRLTLVVTRPSFVCLPASTGADFALRALETLAVQEGHAGPGAERWLDRLPQAAQSTPVLALSSKPGSSLADEVSAYLGRSVAGADPGEELDWYAPPSKAPEVTV